MHLENIAAGAARLALALQSRNLTRSENREAYDSLEIMRGMLDALAEEAAFLVAALDPQERPADLVAQLQAAGLLEPYVQDDGRVAVWGSPWASRSRYI